MDGYVKEDQPDERKGGDDELRVKTEQGKRNHSLIQFDLSSLPSGAAPASAALSLWVKDSTGAPVEVAAHIVESSWNEAQATWANRNREAHLPWTVPGGDYSPAVADSVLVVQKNVWATWDLGAEVVSWLTSPGDNFGVLLEGGVTQPKGEKKFVSSDAGAAERRPTLVVCYDEPPPPVCYELQPGQEGMDGYVKEDQPDERKGGDDELRVKTEQGKRNHSLIQFDLSSLPSGAAPASAALSLWVKDSTGAPVEVAAHVVESSWNEAQATWANRNREAHLPWTVPGGDYSPAVADSVLVVQKNVWATWDLGAEVVSWLTSPGDNFGVLLEGGVTQPKGEKKFVSSDAGAAERRPTLVVCYDELGGGSE